MQGQGGEVVCLLPIFAFCKNGSRHKNGAPGTKPAFPQGAGDGVAPDDGGHCAENDMAYFYTFD